MEISDLILKTEDKERKQKEKKERKNACLYLHIPTQPDH